MKPGETVRLWQRVTGLYAKAVRNELQALENLKACKLDEPALMEAFQIGFSNGSLTKLLPKAGEVIDNLRGLGVLNEKNEEALLGCITLPLVDAAGNACGLYGLKFTEDVLQEICVPATIQGVFNRAAVKFSHKLLVAGSILDALALWQSGFRTVVAFYGAEPSSEMLEELFSENNACEVYLCLGPGSPVAIRESLKAKLAGRVKSVRSLQWPDGVQGAYDFLLRHSPEKLEALLNVPQPGENETKSAPAQAVEPRTDGFEVGFDGRRYDLRAIEKPSAARLKATIRALGENGRFVIDTIDFYLSRSRRGFMCEAARLFGQQLEVVESDLNRITEQVEAHVQSQLQDKAPKVASVSEADRAEGLKLGCSADLLGEIARDLEQLGMVGERANKVAGYLVMSSRKLSDPLGLLILSGSGAGKSHLQDSVLALCPEEDVVKLTSLTQHALFYKAEHSLRNKVLAIEELAGARGADYAIRNLISAKKLVIETTVKNALTGKLETQVNTVYGPTAIFQTTTNPHTDPETRSRFILVSVDESPEQTRAILQVQRQSHTLAGLCRAQQREQIIRRHHAFQRLLRPLLVVNPFEPLLAYPDEHLLVRREQPKYLSLILTVAFLHQLQRPLRHHPQLGNFLEVTLEDIAVANQLAHQLFAQSLDDLSPPARELLRLIGQFMQKRAASDAADKATFQRRELREAIKWSDTRLRTHLRELVEMERVLPVSGRFGQTYRYRLVDREEQGTSRFLAGLKSIEQLRQEANLAGLAKNPPVQNAGVKKFASASEQATKVAETATSPGRCKSI